jgi:hypothetical protein
VEGRPAFADAGGAILTSTRVAHGGGTHLRSSREHATLRGVVREPWTLAVAPRAFTHEEPSGARAMDRRISASRPPARTTKRCADRFEKGTRPPKDGTNLHSGRSGPAGMLPRERVILRKHACVARQPFRPSLARSGRGKGAWRLVPSERSTRNRCGSWWCPCIVDLQKSAERPRAQRSVPPVSVGSKACTIHGAREREPDGRRRSARKRKRPPVAKGGRILIARRSSSRERRCEEDGHPVSFAPRRERDARDD